MPTRRFVPTAGISVGHEFQRCGDDCRADHHSDDHGAARQDLPVEASTAFSSGAGRASAQIFQVGNCVYLRLHSAMDSSHVRAVVSVAGAIRSECSKIACRVHIDARTHILVSTCILFGARCFRAALDDALQTSATRPL